MDYTDAPIDPESAQRLAAKGLTLGLVDTSDHNALVAWNQAISRGFHGDALGETALETLIADTAYRRTTQVTDAAEPELGPVATVSSWSMPLTVPHGAGTATVPTWAVSEVTVSPTHRRRGIARAMLEGELRTAAACGIPVAGLTATEATIYGRYGFAPAAFASTITIDTFRTEWAGPRPAGRVRFVDIETVKADGPAIYERARLREPGQATTDTALFTGAIGIDVDKPEKTASLRAVQYRDEQGEAQGFAVYRVVGSEDPAKSRTVEVEQLAAATDDAYAALWDFVIEIDLVQFVRAPFRSVDEPLVWQLSNPRAVSTTRGDMLWLRIIDPVEALRSRTYSRRADVLLEVTDPLGFADGGILLRVGDDGRAEVNRVDPASDDIPAGAARVALSVNDLASLYLGGVSATSLHRSGHLKAAHRDDVVTLGDVFSSHIAPRLGIIF